MTTKFEYLLNAMENAATQAKPSEYDYAGKRQMVLAYVAELEEALRAIIEEANQSNGGKGARLPIVIYMRELAESALKVNR